MGADTAARRRELSAFLTRCRARVTPRELGLPSFGTRRVPGLRREEVAELAGVSPRWYELFESGSARRFSSAFIARVADTLQLDERERATLARLALPEVAAASDLFERSAKDGALQHLAQIRELSRRIGAASSYEEAAHAAIETTQRAIGSDCMTVASLERDRAAPIVLAVGPRARYADAVLARTVLDANEPARHGLTVLCENAPAAEHLRDADAPHPVRLRRSDGSLMAGMHRPDPDGYRDYNGRARKRSGSTVGLFQRGVFRGNLMCSWMQPRIHSTSEVDIIETVAAILELA